MAYDIGPRIGIDGEAEFRRAIQNINTNVRTLGTEMLAVTSAYDANDRSAAALTARNQVLVKQIDAQKEKLAKLQEGLAASAAKYGESDEKTQRWQQTVNKATAELNSMERELASNTREMNSMGDASEEAADAADKLSDGISSTTVAIGNLISSGVEAAVGVLRDMVSAVWNLDEATAEYRESQGKINTAFESAGYSADTARDAYNGFYKILGDTGTAAEASQLLAKLAESEEDVAHWTDIAAGVSGTFGDALPINGLIEAANETAKVGQITGVLADALNWAGISEDAFNEKLATCATESDRSRLVMSTLSDTYSEAASAFYDNNAAIVQARENQAMLDSTMAGLGETVSQVKNNLQSEFLPSISAIASAFSDMLNGVDGADAAMSAGIQGMIETAVSLLPGIIETGGSIIEAILSGIAQNLPELAAAALEVVSTLAAGISDSLPELIPAVTDTVLQIVETLTNPESLDSVIGAALEIIVSLAEGLIEALPRLLEKAPVIIENLVNAIASNLPKILQAGIELIVKLAEGIIQSIPALVGAVPEVIGALIAGFTNYYKSLLDMGKNLAGKVGEGIKNIGASAVQWGRDLIDNFVSGIKNAIGKVKDAVSNVADTVKSFLGFSEPEEGPLSNFHTYAPDMMQLFAKGITDNVGLLRNAFKKSLTFAEDALADYDPDIDYAALMMAASDLEEFQELAAKRAAKIAGENINLTEKGWADNASLMEQWQALAEKAEKNTEETITQLVKGTAGDLADWTDNASEYGADFIGKVIDGLASQEDSLYRAMASVGERAADAFRAGLEGAFELRNVQRELERSMAELAGNASGRIQVSGSVAGQTGGDMGSALAQLPTMVAAAVRAELEGMTVNLSGRKVGELTSRWQANQARAMGV